MLDRSKIEILERIYVGVGLASLLTSVIALAFGYFMVSYLAFLVIVFSFSWVVILALIFLIKDAVRFVLYGRKK